ncbi:MAG TPA: hypothetical protein VGJ36_00445 [Gemmatimonadales bacterium]|jgi:hypothetical protein
MSRSRHVVISLATAALLCGDLEAQSAQAISIQVSGLYNGVFGNVFDGLKDGLGGEVQLRYTPGALSLGAGFQYTVHGLDIHPEDARLYGGFFEPRYRIHTGSNVVAPYLSARFSVLKMGFSGGDLSLSSTFIQLNGGGGLLYRMGPRLNLDVGATFGYNRLGSGTFSSETSGTIADFPPSSGSNVVVRFGFAVGLGG